MVRLKMLRRNVVWKKCSKNQIFFGPVLCERALHFTSFRALNFSSFKFVKLMCVNILLVRIKICSLK